VHLRQCAFAAVHVGCDTLPERLRALGRQRQHEAHRRAAFDTVDQQRGELRKLRIADGR
jgi:hypothetical protein